jgi:deoxyribonucleoside regulator
MSSRDDLLATVASLYYLLNQSQSAIAQRLEMSTSKVSRLLKEAREQGIVDIRVRMPIPRSIELEQQLVETFKLRDAYVLKTSQDTVDGTRLNAIGNLAANYIERALAHAPAGGTVGVAWGTGVHSAVSALPDSTAQNINVVQLVGGVGGLAVDSPDLARMVARKLGGRHYDLPAPGLVERAETRDALMAEPSVQSILQRAQEVYMAIIGIGSLDEKTSSFLRAGLLTSADLAQLRSQGVVGEICGQFFDINGSHIPYAINQRTIGLTLDYLQKVPHVVVVARGLTKAKAIYTALQTRYASVLVTDDETVVNVLAIAQANTVPRI